jgi:hypothetical protein
MAWLLGWRCDERKVGGKEVGGGGGWNGSAFKQCSEGEKGEKGGGGVDNGDGIGIKWNRQPASTLLIVLVVI